MMSDAAFAAMWDRNRHFVQGWLFVRARGNVEDLLQEVLVELWRGGDRFRSESKESTFVIGCARNVLRRFIKKRKNEWQKKGHRHTAQGWQRSPVSDRTRLVGEPQHEASPLLPPWCDTEDDNEPRERDVTEAAQLDRLIVREFVAALDPRQLESAALVVVNGATEEEAAGKIGISSSHIRALKRQVRQAWEGGSEAEPAAPTSER